MVKNQFKKCKEIKSQTSYLGTICTYGNTKKKKKKQE